MNVAARLTKVEEELERRRLIEHPMMRGAYEMHCIGGLGHVEGTPCQEHENCVFKATPITANIRRVISVNWREGMSTLELG